MPDPQAPTRPRPSAPRIAWRTLGDVAQRLYSVALIVVIVWLTFYAVCYLINTLFVVQPAPPQVTELPTRLTESVLETRRQAWSAVQATEHPRAPLAHYHRLEGWVRPDSFNDCTRSGCHAPLPHARRKEVRAFLNLHATSLHCGVCHMQSADTPLALTWYDLGTGKPAATPAALQAYDLVTSPEGRKRLAAATAADQSQLVKLLRTAAEQADNVRGLVHLADRVAAVRPDSEAFATLIDAARDTLPRHFRGEYGAKLALRDRQTGKPLLAHPGSVQAVQDYLSAVQAGKEFGADERGRLLDRVHAARRPQPRQCQDCHRSEGSAVDLAAVGYPAARREALATQVIFHMVEQISAGRPMHLPQFVTSAPAQSSAPATQPNRP